ncbi:hypothetical protein CMU02_11910 [Elizabethkingia anophelis]|uniref:hypothetical protein n=1 Tax=Elizabethkingia anophelis TaxID=1117645 RepID=UPI002935368D|nr:hypothetical protein [Elizabethkingia anophelis]MDV3472086.1 hypothetical protein [Elizabethkingia anophelis]MDV3905506.1 hypothetical protein [Elizabethkingia anophelis]
MKKYTKIIFLLLTFSSMTACAQVKLNQKKALIEIKNNESDYKGENLSELLAQSPDMKMVSIFKNFPEGGVITFTIAFQKNKDYYDQINKKMKPSNITVYTKQDPLNPIELPEKTVNEDIGMKDAIKKYGNLKIIAVYLVTP